MPCKKKIQSDTLFGYKPNTSHYRLRCETTLKWLGGKINVYILSLIRFNFDRASWLCYWSFVFSFKDTALDQAISIFGNMEIFDNAEEVYELPAFLMMKKNVDYCVYSRECSCGKERGFLNLHIMFTPDEMSPWLIYGASFLAESIAEKKSTNITYINHAN